MAKLTPPTAPNVAQGDNVGFGALRVQCAQALRRLPLSVHAHARAGEAGGRRPRAGSRTVVPLPPGSSERNREEGAAGRPLHTPAQTHPLRVVLEQAETWMWLFVPGAGGEPPL